MATTDSPEKAAPGAVARDDRAPADQAIDASDLPRFGRLPLLLFVLIGTVLVGLCLHAITEIDFANSQFALAMALVATALFLMAQAVRYRATMLLGVVLGTLLAGLGFYFLVDVELHTGQLAAFTVVVAAALFFLTQAVRHRFRVRLRTLLLGMAVLAAILAFFGKDLVEARNEAAAVNSMKDFGVVVTYREHVPQNAEYFYTDNDVRLPVWILNTLGESFFREIQGIRFRQSEIEDQHLFVLAGLRSAKSMDLRNSHITAQGIASMPVMPGVEELDLEWSQVSAEAIANVGRQPNLRTLYIGYSDSDLSKSTIVRSQGRLPHQESENYAHPALLQGLGNVEHLILEAEVLYDSDLQAIAALPNLRTLNLITADFAPAPGLGDFKHLATSRSIESLHISLTGFSDKHLQALVELQSLKYLRISHDRVTPEGVQKFRDARPDVELVPR